MKFFAGIIKASFQGSVEEYNAVRALLTFDDQPSFMDDHGMMYTGLIGFVKEHLSTRFPVEVVIAEDNARPELDIKAIDIPADFLQLDNPAHRLRPYQITVSKKAIHAGRGIIEAATSAGKTEMAAIIFKYLLERGLVRKGYFLAGTQFLMGQSADRLERRGVPGVSRFGGGHKFAPGVLQCSTTDSLYNALRAGRTDVVADFAECDIIFWDEAHHLSAASWVFIGETCKAKYRYALTATVWSDPLKYSHEDFYLLGLAGDVIARIPSVVLRRQGILAEPFVTLIDVPETKIPARTFDNAYRAGIVEHIERNTVVQSVAHSLYQGGFKTLVFVSRVVHGKQLLKNLRNAGCENVLFVKGGQQMFRWWPSGHMEMTRTSIEELARLVNESTEPVIVIGNVVLDEGIDIPAFNALIMGTAMKKYRRSIQRIGRGMRPKEENWVYVFDMIDSMNKTLLEHSQYRVQTYQMEEYTFSKSLEETSAKLRTPIQIDGVPYVWENLKD